MDEEEKITLDKIAFKALASETRIALLRKLGERRFTQTELAKETGLSVQAVSEHLEKLEYAGLVSRVEREGRKWVYYELTGKGEAVLNPEKKRIWVLLGATLLIAITAFLVLSPFQKQVVQEPVIQAEAIQGEELPPGLPQEVVGTREAIAGETVPLAATAANETLNIS